MKKSRIIFCAIALFLAGTHSLSAANRIQIAILLDTSNSMDGLINQAKSQLWSIVTEAATMRYNNEIPRLEIALYHYGNDGIRDEAFVEKVLDLTTDLDMVSEKLHALRTNGGTELCGAAIKRSVRDLKWSTVKEDLKMIYIAGNEPFNQGNIDYKASCEEARKKGIVIHTLFCGDQQEGIRTFWKDGATCSGGTYININPNSNPVAQATPYDQKIAQLGTKLSTTYVAVGNEGKSKAQNQAKQDSSASSLSASVMAERAVAKSSVVYRNDSWDLIDAIESGKIDLNKIDKSKLPDNLKNMSVESIEKIVTEKKAERQKIQEEIKQLNKDRTNYIQANSTPSSQSDLGSAVNASFVNTAIQNGYQKSKNP